MEASISSVRDRAGCWWCWVCSQSFWGCIWDHYRFRRKQDRKCSRLIEQEGGRERHKPWDVVFGLEQRVSTLPQIVFPTTLLLSDLSQTFKSNASTSKGMENIPPGKCLSEILQRFWNEWCHLENVKTKSFSFLNFLFFFSRGKKGIPWLWREFVNRYHVSPPPQAYFLSKWRKCHQALALPNRP